jgi:hypothetical protein
MRGKIIVPGSIDIVIGSLGRGRTEQTLRKGVCKEAAVVVPSCTADRLKESGNDKDADHCSSEGTCNDRQLVGALVPIQEDLHPWSGYATAWR